MNFSKNISDLQMEKRILALITLVFLVCSAIFIYRTSFIAIDGKRYFCLFDDAMISMRYAWNFSHGAGLVWNAGERVQGYTNLLMTLLMSLTTLVFDKSIAALSIQILGVGFMLAIATLSMRIADRVTAGENTSQQAVIRILTYLFALAYYPLMYWSLTGMETGLLAGLLALGVFFALQFTATGRPGSIVASSLLMSLAFLTRNDSLIFAVLIWVYLLWEILKARREPRNLVYFFSAILLYLVVAGGEFLFQYSYYGEALPNTYTLKLTGMPLLTQVSNGLNFTLPFLVQVSFILLPAIFDTYLHFNKEKLLLLSLFLAAVAYQVYVGGDPWNYWRMMSPTMPLLGILFIDMVYRGAQSQAGKQRLFARFSFDTQVVLLVFIGIIVANSYFLPEILFLDRPFYVSANQHNVNIAIALQEVTTPEATAGIFWAGAIPYFAERNGIDFLGKSDRYIAQLPADLTGRLGIDRTRIPPGHNKYDLDYSIKQLQPTYVQDFKWGSQDLTDWARTRYVRVIYKGVELFLLKGSPAVLWEKVEPLEG